MPATILVVEDDDTSRALVAYLLDKAGYTVRTASDGGEGLDAALRDRPDLILMDVQMPVMDGYQLTRALRSRSELQNVRLVAVTAVAMVGDRDRILRAGLDSYIAKPIMPEDFVAQVEDLLEPHQRVRRTGRPSAPGRASAELAGRQRPPAGDAPPVKGRVLVVDDKADNLRLARTVLASSGYRVDTALDLETALFMARQSPPDLILSDVHLAGESGYDLVGWIRADLELLGIPVVLISASAPSRPASDRLAALGVSNYLVRPVDPAELLACVEASLTAGDRD